jgi:hypothetical protein
VLVHALSACTSLLYTKRLASPSYQAFRSNIIHGAFVTANPEADDGMLASSVKLPDGMLASSVKLPNLLDTFVWKVSYYSTQQWDSGVFSDTFDMHSLGNLQLFGPYAMRTDFSQPVILFKSVTNCAYLTLH